MADNRSIPTMVNGTSHFTQTGYRDKYFIKKQDLNPSKDDISLYGQHLSEKTECSDRYYSLQHQQAVIKDSSPFGCHDGRDRRIAVSGENNNSYDRRIAVRAGSHTDRELLSPFHDRHSASSYTSSGAEETYKAHKSGKDNYSKEKSKNSSYSGTHSSLHSSNRSYSSYRNRQSDLMDIACTSSSSKMRTWEASDSDSPYKVSTSVTSKYEDEIDAEQNIIDKEKYEKQKKKELQKARRMHRKIKRLEALKQTESDIQLTSKKCSDTDCEDEVLSEASPKKLKIDCDISSTGKRVRTSSQSSHNSSKPKHQSSATKSPKSDKNSNTGKKSDTIYSSVKLSAKEVIKRQIPFIDNVDSRETTAEEGELKSSESSQCDDSDFKKRNSENSGVSSNELKIIEGLKKKNIEFQAQVKELNFELRTRKKSLTRQTKDNDTKIENLEQFYQDELEALRKEISYLKKKNDRERDITDNAKAKERDLLNKGRRLEDSLLHSGKENLDLKEKLKRLTEENDSFRYDNYTRNYPPPPMNPPPPHPPVTHSLVTHPLEYGYQPPNWGH